MEYDYWQLGDDEDSIELMDFDKVKPIAIIRFTELLSKAGYAVRK